MGKKPLVAAAAVLGLLGIVPATVGAQTVPTFSSQNAPEPSDGISPAWSAAVLPRGAAAYDLWSNNHHYISGVITNVGRTGSTFVATGGTRHDTHGTAAFDVDGDGDLDIVEVAGAKAGEGEENNRLFINNGSNGFTLRANSGLERGSDRGRGVTPFDVDGDGDLDVLLSSLNSAPSESVIMRNNGSGYFTVMADNNNVVWPWLNFGSVSAITPGGESYLFGSRANSFARIDVKANAGAITAADVVNTVDFSSNSRPEAPNGLRDAVFGDFDGDLKPEAIVTRVHYDLDGADEEFAVRLGQQTGYYAEMIDINGTSSSIVSGAIPKTNATDGCWSASAADFDNDGDLDVLMACAGPFAQAATNTLLVNDGTGKFTISTSLPAAPQQVVEFGDPVANPRQATAKVVVTGDWNNDGAIDAFVGYGHDSETARDQVWTNNGASGNWASFDLDSNDKTNGIGAQIYVGAGGKWQARQVGHSMHVSQDAMTMHFGLGSATTVDEVLVVWPNGSVEAFAGTANKRATVAQGTGDAMTKAELTAALAAKPGTKPEPKPEPKPTDKNVYEQLAESSYAGSSGRDGALVRLYAAMFLRLPDDEGFAYWQARELQTGLRDVAWAFINSEESQLRYGSVSDEEFVRLLYVNILDREPDAEGYEYWLGVIARDDRMAVLLGFSESVEFKLQTSTS